MANICTTTYKITGTRKAVTDLWNSLTLMEVNSKHVMLYQLADFYGIEYEKRRISVRGHIYFAELESNEETGYYLLTIETETAWTGCHDLFNAINKDILWGELSISYREIECGCEIFAVHDEGEFFTEECCVSSYGEPFEEACEDVYDTIDDAIKEWCEKMGKRQGERTLEEMMDYINGYEYDAPDTYFYINSFEFE